MTDLVKNKNFWVAFILIVFLFFIIFRPQTKADLVYFYPQTCLGSFVNPEKAQGEREVDNPDLINELNSAVYYSGFKEIYCGNFQGPIKEGEIKKVTLHFNWVITKELREKPIIESTSSENLIEKIIPSRTIEINVGTSNIPINETQNNTNTNDTLNNTKNDTNSNEFNNTNTNSNETNNTNDNKSQTATSSYEDNKKSEMYALSPKKSVYIKFINFVFAQEEKQNELQRISETNGNEINNTNSNESQTASSSYENINQSEESVLSPNQSASKTLFDIHYTLDGQNWNYLGSVNENNWQNLTFDIPVNNWLDISKIQIKINSLPDTDYYLYLESMWLEVEYENSQATLTFQTLTGGMVGTIISPFISNETATTTQEGSDNAETSEIIEEMATTTEEPVPSTTIEEVKPIIQEPLKIRKFEKIINIKNTDNLSCSTDQFSINISEGETKFVNFKLKGERIKNLEIGSLPAGIDIVFAENNDYQISTNDDIVQLKIYRQRGSEKGNFSLPIIFSSKNSTIICQINVITN
jgi:hypothetical protein